MTESISINNYTTAVKSHVQRLLG